MSQVLTDDEIAVAVREATQGSAIRRDGTTSQRIARAVENAVLTKLAKEEPVLCVAIDDLQRLQRRNEGDAHIKAWLPPVAGGSEVPLYLHPPQTVPEDGRKGFSLYLDREEWGHVIDGLSLERQRSEQRKAANPDSNSDAISDRCAVLIGRINTASAESFATAPSPEGS